MYECPNCAGNMKYDIPSCQLICYNCDTKMDPYSYVKDQDAEESTEYDVTVFRCPQCAGEIISTDETAATFCSFCGSSTILDSRLSKEKRPTKIIPFKKTKTSCKNAYIKAASKMPFIPDDLLDENCVDGFRGIYMPYWSYDITQQGPVTMQGTHRKQQGDYQIIKEFEVTGNLDAHYYGFSHDASSSFDDSISEYMDPFNMTKAIKFTPSFLSGFYADTSDISKEVFAQQAINQASENTIERIQNNKMIRKMAFEKIEDKAAKTHTVLNNAELNLFPVWFMSYRNKDRIAYATVNGQSGNVLADFPIDEKKFFKNTGIVALIIFIIMNLFFTLRPVVAMTIAMVLSVISIIIYSIQISKIKKKEKHKLPAKQIFGLFGSIIAVLLSLIVMIWNPVNDIFYYIAVVLCLCGILSTLLCTIHYYNMVATRPLPQFETHKGGDDNA